MANLTADQFIPYDELAERLKDARDGELYQAIVDAPFDFRLEMALLFLGFICFYLVDDSKQDLWVAAVSDTEHYRQSVAGYDFKMSDYRIALSNGSSPIARAITSGEPQSLTDWSLLARPKVSGETARINQASSGISYSHIYPLTGKLRGALMYNFFQYQGTIGTDQQDFMLRYTKLVSDALEQQFKIS